MKMCRIGCNGFEVLVFGIGVMLFFNFYGEIDEVCLYVILDVVCEVGVI